MAETLDNLRISRKLTLSEKERTSLIAGIEAIAVFVRQQRGIFVELDVNLIILDAEGQATAVDALFRVVRVG